MSVLDSETIVWAKPKEQTSLMLYSTGSSQSPVLIISFYNDDYSGSMEWAPTQGPQLTKKKEQSQANVAGSKKYAEEKLQDFKLQRLCVCS